MTMKKITGLLVLLLFTPFFLPAQIQPVYGIDYTLRFSGKITIYYSDTTQPATSDVYPFRNVYMLIPHPPWGNLSYKLFPGLEFNTSRFGGNFKADSTKKYYEGF